MPCAHYVSAEEMPTDQDRARSDNVFHLLCLVVGGIVYGLLGEQLGIRTVYHSPRELFGVVGQIGRRAQEITKGTCSEVGGGASRRLP